MLAGKRVIPEAWIDEAAKWQVPNGDDPDNDWNQGYGYQFWRCRHNAYRGDGALGQYCVIVPHADLVVASTGALKDMAAVLSLMWDCLLPAMGDAPLGGKGADEEALRKRLARLTLPCTQGETVSPVELKVRERRYVFPDGSPVHALTLTRSEDDLTLLVEAEGGTHAIRAGRRKWVAATTSLTLGIHAPFPNRGRYDIAANAAWTAPDTLTLTVAYVEMPFALIFSLVFDTDSVEMTITQNVTFGTPERPVTIGTAE
jgi:hypothetical protein